MWKPVKYRGIKCLIYEGTPHNSIRDKYPYVRWLRHSETDWSTPMSIETYVLVNRWGCIISEKEILPHGLSCIELSYPIRNRFREAIQ